MSIKNFISSLLKNAQSKVVEFYPAEIIVDKFMKEQWDNTSDYEKIIGLETRIWHIGDYTIKHDRQVRGDLIGVYTFADYMNGKTKDRELIAYVDQSHQYSFLEGISDVTVQESVNKIALTNLLLNTDWNNKDVVLPLIKQNGNHLQYCSDEMKKDVDCCSEAIRAYKDAIKYVSDEVKNDIGFMLPVLEDYVSSSRKYFNKEYDSYIKQIKNKYTDKAKELNNEDALISYIIKSLFSEKLQHNISKKLSSVQKYKL